MISGGKYLIWTLINSGVFIMVFKNISLKFILAKQTPLEESNITLLKRIFVSIMLVARELVLL